MPTKFAGSPKSSRILKTRDLKTGEIKWFAHSCKGSDITKSLDKHKILIYSQKSHLSIWFENSIQRNTSKVLPRAFLTCSLWKHIRLCRFSPLMTIHLCHLPPTVILWLSGLRILLTYFHLNIPPESQTEWAKAELIFALFQPFSPDVAYFSSHDAPPTNVTTTQFVAKLKLMLDSSFYNPSS